MKPLITATQKDRTTLPRHLRRLEAESIEIMRDVVAEFKKPVMLYSIGKDFERHAACRAQGVPSGKAPVPAAACRHHLEVPRHDRVSRRDRQAPRARSDRACQPGGPRPRHQSDRIRLLAAHPGDEDRCAEAGARCQSIRCRLRRRPPRRGEEPGERADLLVPLGGPWLGPAPSAPRTVESVQHTDPAGRDHAGVRAVELDRARCLGIHHAGRDSGGAALLCRQSGRWCAGTAP